MPIPDARFVDVEGVRTRYFERGSGETVVLVHGGAFGSTTGACSADDWDLNFDGLAKWFRVFAIDKLGQGYTGNPRTDDDYTMHATVQHAYATLRALGIEGRASGGPFAGRLPRLPADRRASRSWSRAAPSSTATPARRESGATSSCSPTCRNRR